MEKIDVLNRKYRLWFYHVTHGEAIIRSLKGEKFEKNIDIYFGDIQYIEMPTTALELKIESACENDVLYLSNKIGKKVCPDNVTVLVSEEHRYYIVASVNKVTENSLEMFELPIAIFMRGIM